MNKMFVPVGVVLLILVAATASAVTMYSQNFTTTGADMTPADFGWHALIGTGITSVADASANAGLQAGGDRQPARIHGHDQPRVPAGIVNDVASQLQSHGDPNRRLERRNRGTDRQRRSVDA